MAEKVCRLEPLFWILAQQGTNQLGQGWRRARRNRRPELVAALVEGAQFLWRRGVEWRAPGQALVDDGADRVEVCRGVVDVAHQDLGRHVHWRAAQRCRHVRPGQVTGKAKIG